ncbi:transcriptional initiation protein Tat [Selenomonas sp. F0473]|uniref:transcriptional initiation protein Tat n=1 Tax=Selenomonas sp. F0473 TaxID=999423 RepID=UPI0025F2EF59|nr:transcriptional initiation protein Tat [Selenomonas sp. F0473]
MTPEEWRERLAHVPVPYIAAGTAAAACIFGGVIYASWDTDPPAVIERPPQGRAPVPEGPREIAGLDAAAQRAPLRDPFTYIHETRGETVEGEKHRAADERTPAGTAPVENAASPVAAGTQPGTPPAKQGRPALRGTVTGTDGRRIAIIALDKESAALSVGETWRDYVVEDVGDSAVTLRRGGETITLRRE